LYHGERLRDPYHVGKTMRMVDLIINQPPGTSKSQLTSAIWQSWIWAHNPSLGVIAASFDKNLVARDGTTAKALINSDWYQSLFGDKTQLDPTRNTRSEFFTTAGGWRYNTTPGAGATGWHPHIQIVDDSVNPKQAESETEREKANEWWDLTMTSRGAGLDRRRVVIQQRLHRRDQTGHIIDNPERVDERYGWFHLCLPMRYETDRPFRNIGLGTDPRTKDGELLWPEVYPEEKVRSLERTLGPYGTAGQMQQRPHAKSGNLFKPDGRLQFITEEQLPRIVKVARGWDKAGTKGAGCYTSGVLLGTDGRIGNDGKMSIYILDVKRDRLDTDEVENLMRATADLDRAKYKSSLVTGFEVEPGASGKQAARATIRKLRGHVVIEVPARGAKEYRAVPMAQAVNNYEVFCLEKPWAQDLVDEMRSFPSGAYLDQVDAMSVAYVLLTEHISVLAESPSQRREREQVELIPCAHPECDRPAEDGYLYCCEGCERCHADGVPHAEIGIHAHSHDCNERATDAYANGLMY